MYEREAVPRLVALALCLTTLGLPAASTFLDAHQPRASTHVESSHDADRCAFRHDHRACLLLVVSGAPADGFSEIRRTPDLSGFDRILRYPAPVRAFLGSPLPPRGPPPHLG